MANIIQGFSMITLMVNLLEVLLVCKKQERFECSVSTTINFALALVKFQKISGTHSLSGGTFIILSVSSF